MKKHEGPLGQIPVPGSKGDFTKEAAYGGWLMHSIQKGEIYDEQVGLRTTLTSEEIAFLREYLTDTDFDYFYTRALEQGMVAIDPKTLQ